MASSDSGEEEVPELVASDPAVPLTLVTGYLGSGKSTLLQYILREQHGRRIAVIMNEFGNTSDIESKSVGVAEGDSVAQEWLELNNGCLCCSVRDTGLLAMQELMSRKGRFDYIILETTGLADPAPIVHAFWNEPALCLEIMLDAVVCVVDADGIVGQLAEQRPDGEYNEAQRQLAGSDVVLINKVDLVDKAKLSTVKDAVASVNSTAITHETTRSVLPIDAILDLNMYASPAARKPPTLAAFKQAEQHDNDHSSHAHASSSPHLGDITTVTIPLPSSFGSEESFTRFERVLGTLLLHGSLPPDDKEDEYDVLRTKAYLRRRHRRPDESETRAYVLQGVRETYEVTPVPASQAESDLQGVEPKLVLIGRRLTTGNLEQRFLSAIAS